MDSLRASPDGATEATYTLVATALTDNGRQYRVVISNELGTVTSGAATLTVSAVAVPPPTGGAAACIDRGLLQPGYGFHVVLAEVANPLVTSTLDGQVNGTVLFEGHPATEIQLTAHFVQPAGVDSTTVYKTYSTLDASYALTVYGSTMDATSVALGHTAMATGKLVITPPVPDLTYTLLPGQSTTLTRTEQQTGSGTLDGVPQPPVSSTTTETVRTDFIGIESITVPAGTFDACKFVRSTLNDAGVATRVTTDWQRVGDGIGLRSQTGSQATVATAISTH